MSNKKIIEAVEVHEELNPKLWDGMELKQDVKEKLLEIANTFIEGLDFPINVADIRFLGSNASFNYNDKSDIDLHIISNFDLVYIDKDILQTLYNNCKNNFNRNHDITIHDIPVELYIEDMNSMNATNGSYSLLKDEWVMIPQPIEYEIPDYSKELNIMTSKINVVLRSNNKEEVENLINEIYLGRKDGLATGGEASIGNLVFKELRNMELIDKLRERFYELESQELTLENKLIEHYVPSEFSKDEIKEKEDEYREYIATHIANVHNAYKRIVMQFVEDKYKNDLETNLDNHDKDKSYSFIFDAYRRNHYPITDKEKDDADEDYDIAWFYHKKNNPHHWEYWLNSNDEFTENPDEYKMKLAYYEMLCDWLSFGFRKDTTSATGESNEFEVWYNESKNNIKIHPQLKEWLDSIISQIIGYIKDNKEEIYNEEGLETGEKYLTNIETYGKIEKENLDVNKRREVKLEMTEAEKQKELNRMTEWVNVIMEGKKLEESSMSKVAEYISHYQVGFITAFRQGKTKADNQDNNYNLKLDIIQDLDKTKLSYIKVDGTYPEQEKDENGNDIPNSYVQVFEETFAVINDQYMGDDFIKIMCSFAKKYEQDSTLIVFPPADTTRKIEDNVTAAEYDGDGNKIATYKGFTVSVYDKYKDKNTDIMEYYTKIGNKKLSFSNRQEVMESIDKEPEYDIYTYRLKKKGNLGGMLEAQRKHYFVEKLLEELKSKDKLQEMNYREFKQDTGFALDFNVKVPLKFTQESDFDTIEDDRGNDIEMDIDVDSLWDAEQQAQNEVEEMLDDEDYLKEIFPNVGLGRVYVELIGLEEDELEFNIGFSDIVDPVEKGNDIKIDKEEIIEQIKDLAENIIDNIGYIDARQSYEDYTGDVDEDGDPIYDTEYSDETVSFLYSLDTEKEIQIALLEK